MDFAIPLFARAAPLVPDAPAPDIIAAPDCAVADARLVELLYRAAAGAGWAAFLDALMARADAARAGVEVRGPAGVLCDEQRVRAERAAAPARLAVVATGGVSARLVVFGGDAGGLLRTLDQHFAAAVELFADRCARTATQAALRDALDRGGAAGFVLDHALRIVAAPPAGATGALRVREGRLFLPDHHRNRAFQRALAEAVRQPGFEAFLPAGGTRRGLLVRSGAGAPRRVLVLAAAGGCRLVAARIAALFGLNRREAALAVLLAEGANLTDAARALGLAENTVRTYSKNLLHKAGVRRQADLVRVLWRDMAVLGARPAEGGEGDGSETGAAPDA